MDISSHYQDNSIHTLTSPVVEGASAAPIQQQNKVSQVGQKYLNGGGG